MPPRHQPPTLRSLSVSHIGRIIFKTCESFSHRNSRLDEDTWIEPIKQFQSYLLQIQPLWDEVCDLNLIMNRPVKMCDFDIRILLSVVVFKGLRTLKFTGQVYSAFSMLDPRSVRQFLPELGTVRHLDLSGIHLTDSDLFVIGQHVLELEEIVLNTNGHTLSPAGLSNLESCTKLRSIKDYAHLPTMKTGGIASLLRALPELVYLDYIDIIAAIISLDDVPSLKLQQINNTYVRDPDNLVQVALMCPNLRSIELWNKVSEASSGILTTLSTLQLPLTSLTFRFFSINDNMKDFLRAVGIQLTSLKLSCLQTAITISDFTTIGELCPNLEVLDIFSDPPPNVQDHYYRERRRNVQTAESPPSRVFEKLTSVRLSGFMKDKGLLFMSLAYSLDIQSIIMENSCNNDITREQFRRLLQYNPLVNLKCFRNVGIMSPETIQDLYSLPNLTNLDLSFIGVPDAHMAQTLDEIKADIRNNNYKIAMSVNRV